LCFAKPIPRLRFGTSIPRLRFGTSIPRLRFATSIPRLRFATSIPRLRFATSIPRLRFATSIPRLRFATQFLDCASLHRGYDLGCSMIEAIQTTNFVLHGITNFDFVPVGTIWEILVLIGTIEPS
jgi:hypothetical protein